MERKIWLKTFLDLADGNYPTIEYRKRLRLKSRDLGPHINRIPKYRAELAAILEKEAEIVAQAVALALEASEKEKKAREDAARLLEEKRMLDEDTKRSSKEVERPTSGTKRRSKSATSKRGASAENSERADSE